MDRITAAELDAWQRTQRAFALLDVRRAKARTDAATQIPGARWLDPNGLFTWKDDVPRDRPVVFACAHGHEISQGCAATLRAMGVDARFLEGGCAGWQASGRPVEPI